MVDTPLSNTLCYKIDYVSSSISLIRQFKMFHLHVFILLEREEGAVVCVIYRRVTGVKNLLFERYDHFAGAFAGYNYWAV